MENEILHFAVDSSIAICTLIGYLFITDMRSKEVITKVDAREKTLESLLKDMLMLSQLIREKLDLHFAENRTLLKDLFESELKIIAKWLEIKNERQQREGLGD